MKIEHIALWVDDLEKMRSFYIYYFGMSAGEKYTNPAKQYTSYFLRFAGADTRIEIMKRPDIEPNAKQRGFLSGMAHFAVAAESKEKVNELTELLRRDKYTIFSEPRTTGDGYYESVILDPEGNYIEITV
jgi:lactoylglutathione lyase